MVNGMLIETEDETSSNPTAMNNGFRSGLARETIFQSDEADFGDLLKIARDQIKRFGEVAGTSAFGELDVEKVLA
jgi:hypothetical protein